MSTGTVNLAWGDAEQRFRLAIGQLRELQDKCDAGPAQILDRLRNGTWRVDDVREPLRLGLIGGGMAPVKALALVQRYCDDRPLMESVFVAQIVLFGALVGDVTDPVGKAPAGEPTADGSASPPSTESGPSSAGTPGASTASLSGSSAPLSMDGTAPRGVSRH